MRLSLDNFWITVAEILTLGIIGNLIGSIAYSTSSSGGAILGVAVAVVYSAETSNYVIQSVKALLLARG